ncbi:MAG: hypothetical protein GX442_20190 [Candidatus Riflebacteria bacterium]|nr:hypothetical protein [Candidatus Riflebacteria bacterium]
MKTTFRLSVSLALLLAVLTCTWPAGATDVSSVPDNQKFLPTRATAISSGIQRSHEIRRPAELEKNPKASIGLWCPWMEPPPVDRTVGNQLTKAAKIFRNTGSTKGTFPFIVQDPADGKCYVYRKVRYHWKFEKAKEGDDPHGGNVEGVSGGDPWTPFFSELSLEDSAAQFILDWAEDKASPGDLPEKKVFPNRHTTVYDSGVQDDETVANSSFLQQVAFTLTYERAPIEVTPTGPGYPETDADTADLPTPELIEERVKGTVALNTAPADDKFVEGKVITPIPDAYKDVWTLGEASAYALVYVEDHQAPDAKPAESSGKDYSGIVGQWLKGGVKIEYVDDNPNANENSDQMKADFKYYAGNNDIYKVENPFYNPPEVREPYLYVFYLRANHEFGPYMGPAKKERERSWYINRHPYWSQKPAEETKAYLNTRYSHAWESDSIPLWELGAIYYVMNSDDGDSGKFHAEELNEAWVAGQISDATCPSFSTLRDSLAGKDQPGAKKAVAALDALADAIKNPGNYGIRGDRAFTRFASCGFSDEKGSYVVGKVKLEKKNPAVHREWTEVVEGVEVKKGEWTVAEKRIILPYHYCTAAVDQCDVACFSSKEVVSVSSSDCCGNSATVESIPTSDGIQIHDEAQGSKPIPEIIIENAGGGDTQVIVPANDSLGADEKLVIKDPATNATQEFAANQYDGDFDLANKDFFVKAGDKLEQIGHIPDDPNGALKDRVVFEDVRLSFSLGGYDNIDGMTPFRGIGKMKFALYALDANKQRGQPETLEYVDENGASQRLPYIERVNGGDPYKFEPTYKFYHIFRNPGWYQAEYELWENSATQGDKKSRKMLVNIHVLDAKSNVRSIEQQERRN